LLLILILIVVKMPAEHERVLTQKPNIQMGWTLVRLLAGAWRVVPPPLTLHPEAVRAATAAAIQGGCAGLVYWRLRRVPEYAAFAQKELRAEYIANGMRAAALAHHLPRLWNALRDEGIEPLLFKGWAIARQYPDVALRPMGDVDLFVPAAQLERARAIVIEMQMEAWSVDLHTKAQDARHAARVTGRTLADLYARSEQVMLGATPVRVLSPEDHLHLLCLYFLRHGGWRPLWLCDIAVALETRPREFDWARALGQGRTADWITCALGAAHRLLDAPIEGMPNAARAQQLPTWFVNAILREWADPAPARHIPPEPMRIVWRSPRRLARAARARWFNPIEASVMVNAPCDETPRLWYQARYWLRQGLGFARRARKKNPTNASDFFIALHQRFFRFARFFRRFL
jgi:hypothetical protein